MSWREISLMVNHEAVEAVADIFNSLRAGGVVVDDPLLLNHFLNTNAWELTDLAVQENTEVVTVTSYFEEDGELNEKLAGLEAELQAVENRIGKFMFGPMKFRSIDEQDWANEWKQYFHTTRVGKNLVIKPTWEEYTALPTDKVIHLDPGMAFGTGTHRTTNMCMQIVEEEIKPDMTVFDVGTGSGILAMAATLCGAKDVKAVDIDGRAVKIAQENIALNGLSEQIEVREGDLLQGTQGQADLIIANIIADIILILLPDVPKKLKPNGLFLTSGIIAPRVDEILAKAQELGLTIKEVRRADDWAAILMCKED